VNLFYCAKCSETEGIHEHRPLRIKSECVAIFGEWDSLINKVRDTLANAKLFMDKHKDLVIYLDNSSIGDDCKLFFKDYQTLSDLLSKISK
jgi:hypothetical protein